MAIEKYFSNPSKLKENFDYQNELKTRQVSSMIHSARPIVTSVANIFCCFAFSRFEKCGRTDGQHVRKTYRPWLWVGQVDQLLSTTAVIELTSILYLLLQSCPDRWSPRYRHACLWWPQWWRNSRPRRFRCRPRTLANGVQFRRYLKKDKLLNSYLLACNNIISVIIDPPGQGDHLVGHFEVSRLVLISSSTKDVTKIYTFLMIDHLNISYIECIRFVNYTLTTVVSDNNKISLSWILIISISR